MCVDVVAVVAQHTEGVQATQAGVSRPSTTGVLLLFHSVLSHVEVQVVVLFGDAVANSSRAAFIIVVVACC